MSQLRIDRMIPSLTRLNGAVKPFHWLDDDTKSLIGYKLRERKPPDTVATIADLDRIEDIMRRICSEKPGNRAELKVQIEVMSAVLKSLSRTLLADNAATRDPYFGFAMKQEYDRIVRSDERPFWPSEQFLLVYRVFVGDFRYGGTEDSNRARRSLLCGLLLKFSEDFFEITILFKFLSVPNLGSMKGPYDALCDIVHFITTQLRPLMA